MHVSCVCQQAEYARFQHLLESMRARMGVGKTRLGCGTYWWFKLEQDLGLCHTGLAVTPTGESWEGVGQSE